MPFLALTVIFRPFLNVNSESIEDDYTLYNLIQYLRYFRGILKIMAITIQTLQSLATN